LFSSPTKSWVLAPSHCLPSMKTVGVPVTPMFSASWVITLTNGR